MPIIILPLGLNSKLVALAAAADLRYLGRNPTTTDKGDGEMGMLWTSGNKSFMGSVNDLNKFSYSVTGSLPALEQALTGATWDSTCDSTMRQGAAAIGG